MKIAIIGQPWNSMVPPVEAGSIAIWTYKVARWLAQGNEVLVYGKANWRQQRVLHHEGVEYRYVWVGADTRLLRLLRRTPWLGKRSKPLFASPMFYLGYIMQVARDLRNRGCDIVHVHNLSQFVPVLRAFNPRLPIAFHSHCEWLTQLGRRMLLRRLRKTNLIIGCSGYVAERAAERFPELAGRCRSVHNGVDTDGLVSGPDAKRSGKRVLFVGRVSPEKGLHVLLEAFEKVLQRHPDASLDVIGPATPDALEYFVQAGYESWMKDIEKFRHCDYLACLQSRLTPALARSVKFLGRVNHSQLAEQFARADVFVNPSYTDAFPLTVLEAMSSGLPVVATKVGGMPEAVMDGKTGLLVNAGDADGLAGGIIRILDNAEMLAAMGNAGRQRVLEHFAWERVAEALLECYREAVEANQ